MASSVLNRFNGGIQELVVASARTTMLEAANLQAETWSPPGGTLLSINVRSSGQLLTFADGGGAMRQALLDSPARISRLRLSPDGKFLAYASFESGPPKVVVASFPSVAEKRQVSSGGGQNPNWRKDGKELFFQKSNGSVWSVDIRTGPKIESGGAKEPFS